MSNLKQLIMQMLALIVMFIVLGMILMYVMKGMFTSFKDSLLTKPYPFVYEKPSSAKSTTVYSGGSIDDFTKKLDSLADRLE